MSLSHCVAAGVAMLGAFGGASQKALPDRAIRAPLRAALSRATGFSHVEHNDQVCKGDYLTGGGDSPRRILIDAVRALPLIVDESSGYAVFAGKTN